MTVLEQRYMNIMSSHLPRLLENMEKLNKNVERLINLLVNENH